MRKILPLLLLITLALTPLGCLPPAAVGLPVAYSQDTPTVTATPTLVQAPPDATATPTPFQPLPPTAVFYPTDTPIPTATLLPLTPTFTPEPPKPRSASRGLRQPPNQINILLLGADARPGARKFRTDTLILATVNSDLGTVNLTSFPRDLYVTLPGYDVNRINTAYEFGGWKLLANTFEYNFGVRPDHYVIINFSSFKQFVDSLGGLDVKVGTTLSDWRAGRYVTIPKGTTHMNADTVLWYVRSRKTSNDFARSRRQQEVLRAIFDKMLSLDALKRFPEFYSLYKNSVITDLSFTDLVRLLPVAAKITDASRINHYFIGPGQVYNWITPGGAMVLLPNSAAIKQVLQKSLNIR